MSVSTLAPHHAAVDRAQVPLMVSFLMLCGGLGLSLAAPGRLEAEDAVDGLMLMLFPAIGGLLVQRGRVPRIGRLFQAAGLVAGGGFLAGGASEHAWAGRPVAGLLATVGFLATVSLLLSVAPFFFPDGELPSRRWRPAVAVAVASAVGAVLTVLLMPGPVDEDSAALGTNPLGVEALEPALEVLELVTFVGFAGTALLGVLSMLLRLRRADARTRRQIAILGAGVAVLVGLFLLDSTLQALGGQTYGVVAAVVALGAVPVATAVALLRD